MGLCGNGGGPEKTVESEKGRDFQRRKSLNSTGGGGTGFQSIIADYR